MGGPRWERSAPAWQTESGDQGSQEQPGSSRLPAAAGPSPRGFAAPTPPRDRGRREPGGREGAHGPGARRRSPSAPHPLWRGESMGFAHSRCNSITALITISISRPDCLLICGKHMSAEVHIPDSAPLPKVQFRGGSGGAGEGREGFRFFYYTLQPYLPL